MRNRIRIPVGTLMDMLTRKKCNNRCITLHTCTYTCTYVHVHVHMYMYMYKTCFFENSKLKILNGSLLYNVKKLCWFVPSLTSCPVLPTVWFSLHPSISYMYKYVYMCLLLRLSCSFSFPVFVSSCPSVWCNCDWLGPLLAKKVQK